jgi:hypothetical protein
MVGKSLQSSPIVYNTGVQEYNRFGRMGDRYLRGATK